MSAMLAWLFLFFSVVSACLTYNMFWPLERGRRRVVLSFFASWLWGELALHAIAVQGLVAIGFGVFGVLETWPGIVALAITIGSCVSLAWGYRHALLAAPVAERALRDAFGRGYEERIEPEHSERFERSIRWRPILRPFPIHHPEVERVRDIPFAREQGMTLKLDVYRHRSMPDGCPTLLQIHGGAWVVGDKREQGLPLMNQLAERGWVCISANYRLSPHATFPEQLIDVKRAIGWIRENGHRYGADPDFLVVTGGSAGGHLAALTALTAGNPEYQPGFEHVDTSVNACVPVYGVYDLTDRHGLRGNESQAQLLEEQVMKGSLEEIPDAYRKASPMDQVTDAAPPFMIIHGDRDVLVPVEEARRFSRLLREHAKLPPVYVEVPGAQHAFELFPSLRTQGIVDAIERFVSYVYSEYRRSKAVRARSGAGLEAGSGPSAAKVLTTTAAMPAGDGGASPVTAARQDLTAGRTGDGPAKRAADKRTAGETATARKAAKAPVRKTAKTTARAIGGAPAKRAVKPTPKPAAKKAAKKAAKRSSTSTAKKATKKTSTKASKKAVKKSVKKTAKKAGG